MSAPMQMMTGLAWLALKETLLALQADVHRNARVKGFYDHVTRTPAAIAARLALIHSEVSEALEALRKMPDDEDAFGDELADVVIRTMDLAEWLGIDLAAAIEKKHKHNLTRPHRHGGKSL